MEEGNKKRHSTKYCTIVQRGAFLWLKFVTMDLIKRL